MTKISGRLAVDLVQSGLVKGTQVERELTVAIERHCATRKYERPGWLREATRRVHHAVALDLEDGAHARRRLVRMEAEAAVAKAVEDGRLDVADRESWTRHYEESPRLAKELLAELAPDPRRANANRGPEFARPFTEDDELAARIRIPKGELI